jgi:hypothetical protein
MKMGCHCSDGRTAATLLPVNGLYNALTFFSSRTYT